MLYEVITQEGGNQMAVALGPARDVEDHAVEIAVGLVITSYSIHYTKLYDST